MAPGKGGQTPPSGSRAPFVHGWGFFCICGKLVDFQSISGLKIEAGKRHLIPRKESDAQLLLKLLELVWEKKWLRV